MKMERKQFVWAVLFASLLPAGGMAQEDLTNKLANPGYETGTLDGWTNSSEWVSQDYLVCSNNKGVYADSYSGNYHMNAWAPNITKVDHNQKVTGLAPGKYVISAMLRMTDSAHPEYVTDQHVYAEVGDIEYRSAALNGDSIGNTHQFWQKLEATFFVTEEGGDVTVGARSTGLGTTPAGWFQADEWKLERVGDVVESEMLEALVDNHVKVKAELDNLMEQEEVVELEAVLNLLNDTRMECEEPDLTVATYTEAIEKMKAVMETAWLTIAEREVLNEAIVAAEELMEKTNYPGIDAFLDIYDAAVTTYDDKSNSLYEQYHQAVLDLEAGRVAYLQSQNEPTQDSPNDMTELYLQYPTFGDRTARDYTLLSPWVNASVITGGKDIWMGPCQPKEAGGNNQPGLNAWSNSFQKLDFYQDIEGLPNGVYKISADVIMGTVEINDQHLYVTSTQGTAVSPAPTRCNYDTYTWEKLESDYIMVTDGKLRIGITSTSQGGTNGWFQVTNFELYYGGTDAGDIVQQQYAKLAEEAEALSVTLLKGDAAVLKAAIATAQTLADGGDYEAACAALAQPLEAARKAGKALTAFKEGALQQLIDLIDQAQEKSTDYKNALNSAYALASSKLEDAASVAEQVESWKASIAAYITCADYLETVAAVLESGMPFAEDYLNETNTTKADQLARMDAELVSAASIDEFIARMKLTIRALQVSALLNGHTDATFLIQSPECQTGNKTSAPEGWTIETNNGTTTTNYSMHWSGDAGNYYLDSWLPTVGELVFTMSQRLENIPNGKYELKAACRCGFEPADTEGRTPEGVFLYANGGQADSVYVEFPKDGNIRGEMWAEAEEEFNATGIESFVYKANGYNGFGWGWRTLEVEVIDHELVIGATCDSTKLGCKPFVGNWYSVDDWSLQLLELGNNDTFENPTAIEDAVAGRAFDVVCVNRRIVVSGTEDYLVYDAAGRAVAKNTVLPAGLYIVKSANGTKKVLVK